MHSVAKALICDTAGNVLVLQRSGSHPSYAHEANLPGGVVEASESPQGAVQREILEETGLMIDQTSLQLSHERTTDGGRHDRVYTAQVQAVKPTISVSWEHESYQWVHIDDVAAALSTADDYMLIVREYLLSHGVR